MPSETDKLITETLLMFAAARTQLEGSRTLLLETKAKLVTLGGCDDEIERIHSALADTAVVLSRLDAKVRYVTNISGWGTRPLPPTAVQPVPRVRAPKKR